MYRNKKIFILGMARSGYECAKLLANDNKILITDMKEQKEEHLSELKRLNVEFIKSNDPIDLLDETYDVLIKNPGIPMSHPTVLKALKLNIPVVNEMEVAYHYLPKNVTIIGVTGSNGKTTTTTLIYELLKKMSIPVHLGGNIGYPLSSIVKDMKENDVLLLEISDHQLINLNGFKTNISVLTNLCPTHLDFHGSYEAYKKSKLKIFHHHTEKDLAILNAANEESLLETKDILSRKEFFHGENAYIKDETIYINGEKIIDLKDIKLKGIHNYENIMASLLVIKEIKLDKEAIFEVLNTFRGVEHRLEFVQDVNGVSYYNDSKSTNPSATITALRSFSSPTRLILGGLERSQDFFELQKDLKNVIHIYALGETKDRIEEFAKKVNIPCTKRDSLKKLMEEVEKDVQIGDTVLLSPASASWDQYEKFEDRGEEFKDIVNNLKNGNTK